MEGMIMIHGILKYDKSDSREHTTRCGKVLGFNEEYSFNVDKITCPRCKFNLLNAYINEINGQLEIFTKISMGEDRIKLLETKKDEYTKKLREISRG